MALRTPWFQERSTLFGLAVLDAFWMGAAYNLIASLRLARVPGLDLMGLLLVGSWTSLSYLSGRYSNRVGRSHDLLSELGRSLLVAALLLGLAVVVFSWGLKTRDPRTFRGFLVPLLLGIGLCSSLTQTVLRQRHGARGLPWLLVSNADDLAVIAREQQPELRHIATQLVPTDAVHALSQELQRTGVADWAGLALGDLHNVNPDVLQDLTNSRNRRLRVSSLVSWCETYLQRVPPELISPEWRLQAEGFELQPGTLSWRIKRIGDLVVAGSLLVLSTPLLLLSAVLIWLEDRGPILYSQERSGIYESKIRILKLRTMQVNAEVAEAQWAQRNDPRITRSGKWLRRLRIDELPQLLNVLKGDMSLIGPRPERPEIDAELARQIPNYRMRYLARPGLSGWAQVCFPYGASVADSRMKLSYDIYYLRNANLLLDLFILIKTIRLVMRGSGSEPHNPSS